MKDRMKRELRSLVKSFLYFQGGVLFGSSAREIFGQDHALLIVAGIATAWLAVKYYKEAKREE